MLSQGKVSPSPACSDATAAPNTTDSVDDAAAATATSAAAVAVANAAAAAVETPHAKVVQAHQAARSDGNHVDALAKLLWVETPGAADMGWRNKCGIAFRHPIARLVVANGIIFMNFLMTAEDPVGHSRKEAELPLIGHDISFLLTRYPDNAGLSFVKAVMALLFALLGCFIGYRYVHGKCLRDRFQLPMFSENKGSWLIMFFTTILVMAIGSQLYNAVASAAGYDSDAHQVTALLGIDNKLFIEIAAIGTWTGDILTSFMVFDGMMQNWRWYPLWFAAGRDFWTHGYNGLVRIFLFWFLIILFTSIVVVVVFHVTWEDYQWDFRMTEIGRSWLAATITLFDLLIVMQDWEFPAFDNPFEIKLPGLPVDKLQFKWLNRCPPFFDILVTGKWFNYGIIFIVMILDLNMYKNQMIYAPEDYGQYVNPSTNLIYSVLNTTLIEVHDASPGASPRLISWETRQSFAASGVDEGNNSKYIDAPYVTKGMSLLPICVGFLSMFFLIKKGKRKVARVLSGNYPQYNMRRFAFYDQCADLVHQRGQHAAELASLELENEVGGDNDGAALANVPADLPVTRGTAYDLRVCVRNATAVHWMTHTDPLCALFITEERGCATDYYLGQTEFARNQPDYDFTRTIRVCHRPAADTQVTLMVFDIEQDRIVVGVDMIGAVTLSLNDLVAACDTSRGSGCGGNGDSGNQRVIGGRLSVSGTLPHSTGGTIVAADASACNRDIDDNVQVQCALRHPHSMRINELCVTHDTHVLVSLSPVSVTGGIIEKTIAETGGTSTIANSTPKWLADTLADTATADTVTTSVAAPNCGSVFAGASSSSASSSTTSTSTSALRLPPTAGAAGATATTGAPANRLSVFSGNPATASTTAPFRLPISVTSAASEERLVSSVPVGAEQANERDRLL